MVFTIATDGPHERSVLPIRLIELAPIVRARELRREVLVRSRDVPPHGRLAVLERLCDLVETQADEVPELERETAVCWDLCERISRAHSLVDAHTRRREVERDRVSRAVERVLWTQPRVCT